MLFHMQIYAYTEEGEEIAAHAAKKGHRYYCPDCHQKLSWREGHFIRPHFFHLKSQNPCLRQGKSLTHLEIQSRLLELLPSNEAFMEKRMPAINRIADVVWEKKKIVFEVQISFISAEEVHSRSLAYRSQGYEIVWILHEHRFGNYRVTAAENYLLNHTHYFTNYSSEGHGWFYDQFSFHIRGRREARLFKRAVDFSCPFHNMNLPALPPRVTSHRKHWKLSFKGDIINNPPTDKDQWQRAIDIESLFLSPSKPVSFIKKITDFIKLVGYLIIDI